MELGDDCLMPAAVWGGVARAHHLGPGSSIWQEGAGGVGAKTQIAFPCSDRKENYKRLKMCGLHLFPFSCFWNT